MPSGHLVWCASLSKQRTLCKFHLGLRSAESTRRVAGVRPWARAINARYHCGNAVWIVKGSHQHDIAHDARSALQPGT